MKTPPQTSSQIPLGSVESSTPATSRISEAPQRHSRAPPLAFNHPPGGNSRGFKRPFVIKHKGFAAQDVAPVLKASPALCVLTGFMVPGFRDFMVGCEDSVFVLFFGALSL